MKPSPTTIQAFQEKILSWYQKNKRDLPWRKTKDPYKILVSEIMLQQTQVDRVIPFFERWIKTFPDVHSLARADTQQLLALWSGLGYNNRALRLRECARALMKNHAGNLPKTYDELVALPGIGDYTANAVLAFAFNKEVPVFDTNIRRVLIHELNLPETIPLNEIKQITALCIPKDKSCIWHNALMDYGALVLTSKKTGIKPLSQQGKFEGSDREVRGFIVRELTTKKEMSLDAIKKKFPGKDVDAIVEKMVGDGLVERKGKKISIEE